MTSPTSTPARTPVEAFAYDLPEERIAQVPAEPRDSARMLVDRGPLVPPDHRGVRDLPSLLDPGDVLVGVEQARDCWSTAERSL